MAGRSAEFKHFQTPAEQVDVVDGLCPLVTALENLSVEGVAATVFSERNIFRPQGNADFFTGGDRLQQRHLEALAAADIDQSEGSVALNQGAGDLVGGAGEVGDEQVGRPVVD